MLSTKQPSPGRTHINMKGSRPAALPLASAIPSPVRAGQSMELLPGSSLAISTRSAREIAQKQRSALASKGVLRPLPESIDLTKPLMTERLAQSRSYKGEIIIFESDAQMRGWAYHWVNQMRQLEYEHWVILTDGNKTCSALHDGWRPMTQRYGEEALSCVWSSFPKVHSGWAQWAPRTGVDAMHSVYQLWSTRWWVALQLLRQVPLADISNDAHSCLALTSVGTDCMHASRLTLAAVTVVTSRGFGWRTVKWSAVPAPATPPSLFSCSVSVEFLFAGGLSPLSRRRCSALVGCLRFVAYAAARTSGEQEIVLLLDAPSQFRALGACMLICEICRVARVNTSHVV